METRDLTDAQLDAAADALDMGASVLVLLDPSTKTRAIITPDFSRRYEIDYIVGGETPISDKEKSELATWINLNTPRMCKRWRERRPPN